MDSPRKVAVENMRNGNMKTGDPFPSLDSTLTGNSRACAPKTF